MTRYRRHAALFLAISAGFFLAARAQAGSWQNSVPFGAALQGDLYTPTTPATSPAILVAIHYCSGSSTNAHAWFQSAADQYGFYIIAPNAGKSCFDSSLSRDSSSDPGAIVTMVKYVITNKNANPSRVFAAGYSSGGCMTNTLLAIFPDVFAGGAALPGYPAGAWPAGDTSCRLCGGSGPAVSDTGQKYADMVTSVFSFSGTRPCSQQWVGGGDQYHFAQWLPVVASEFQILGNLDSGSPGIGAPSNWTRTEYRDGSGNVMLQTNLGPISQTHDLTGANLNGAVISFLGLDKPTGSCGIVSTGTGGAPGTGGISSTGGSGAGGAAGSGGTPGAGGVTSSGGTSGAGGVSDTGGVIASGGTGVGGTGGTTSSGGMPGSGGVSETGGVIASGGIGVGGTGGTTSSGGMPGSGGVSETGGVIASGGTGAGGTGGTTSSGGMPGSGGLMSAGGTTSSGGASGAGGISGAGGLVTSGGTISSGGLSSIGGSVGTGGLASSSIADASTDGGAETSMIDAPMMGDAFNNDAVNDLGGTIGIGDSPSSDGSRGGESGASTGDLLALDGATAVDSSTQPGEPQSESDAGTTVDVIRPRDRQRLYKFFSCSFGHGTRTPAGILLALPALLLLRRIRRSAGHKRA